jgi:SAM-dependent methyltransferase
MDYIKSNKSAWEEAFDNRDKTWGADISEKIKNDEYPFLEQEMISSLKKHSIQNKSIVQFCSNNGRELLSIVKNRAAKGIGFDIAENQVQFANKTAEELEIPCTFHATDILQIGNEYDNQFDVAIITIGALCWFKDLTQFFDVVSRSLKPDGILLINEQHPVTNMLSAPGEDNYRSECPLNICNSYFDKEWIENGGMYYITKKEYKSKTFINYTHSLSEIMSAICKNGLHIIDFREFEYDISGLFESINNKGVPLSYIIEAKKCAEKCNG